MRHVFLESFLEYVFPRSLIPIDEQIEEISYLLKLPTIFLHPLSLLNNR